MERQNCDSECAASIGYDATRRMLEVEYRGGAVYRYHDVPPDEHDALLAAESVGGYLNRVIKTRYRCEKV